MKLLVNKTKIISIITFVICFLGFIFSYEEINGTQSEIYVFSVIGVIELLFCLITLRNVTGRNFSLYGIFIIFAFLFHYGQCLMWAFGIHYPNEIGTANIYTKGIPSGEIIAKSQLLTLIGLLSFHTGALLVMKKAKGTKRQEKFDINIIRTNRKAQALYTASVIALAISLPLMYLYQIRDITVNARYGYGAILYNEIVVASQNNTIQLLRQMYFPAIVGLLISTGYRKKTVYFCYFNFAIFVLLNLMAGNRGEWIYPLAILIWMHHSFVKKINVKKKRKSESEG